MSPKRNEGLDEPRNDALEPELVVESQAEPTATEAGGDGGRDHDARYIEDLQRLQAEFDNYRKRMMREQSRMAESAVASLVERLLPVLDNFDRALAHGDATPGITLVHRELTEVLAAVGLERVEAEGRPFDPHVHEAVESHEDPSVDEPSVASVHRAGYLFKGKVLRPAMVGVARPAEEEATAEESAE